MRKSIIEGIGAGLFIGIGGAVLLACQENRFMGAILFSVALLSICLLGMQLFTGKIGFLVVSHTKEDIISVIGCLIGNLLGTFLAGEIIYFCRPTLSEAAMGLVEKKLALGVVDLFLLGILCGILMYTAVYCYKVKNTISAIFFCVPVFILAGFEHSIADMFYFFAAQSFTLKSFAVIGIVVLGNTVGGMVMPLITRLANPKK
ncbi:MAG: formate/nitrite transporter family protein [Ruminococcaceae bacterium]|nr:formate/nitrite transporter family protein [Oscillospiraceae bacterium]